jgi:hypothetical protein
MRKAMLILSLCVLSTILLGSCKGEKGKQTDCSSNLHKLWMMQNSYMVKHGGARKAMPSETGPAFWLALCKTDPPLLTDDQLDLLVCSASGEKPRKGFTNYWGPAKNVNMLPDGAVVGCCPPGCHANGVVCALRKSGDVQTINASSADGKRMLSTVTGKSGKD